MILCKVIISLHLQSFHLVALRSLQCVSPSSRNLLCAPNLISFRSRKKEERAPESGDERRRDKEMPNFLKDLAHVPGETPHVPQETPHDPQGTPNEPQAGGQVLQGGSRLKW
jgi:hypothetical protein